MSKKYYYYHSHVDTGVFSLVASVGPPASSQLNGSTTAAIDTTGSKLIVISVSSYGPVAAPTLSDSKGNTWTGLDTHIDSDPSTRLRLYYCINPTVGSGHTFTTSGAGSYSGCHAQAFGCTLTPYFDQQTGNNNTNVNSFSPGSITPVLANPLFVTGLHPFEPGAGAITIDDSFTVTNYQLYSAGDHTGNAMAYKINVGLSAENPTWSWTNGTRATVAMASFKSY